MNRDEILTFLKSNLPDLNTRFGVKQIALFGSFARNEENENSDVDLIVELEKKDFFLRNQLKNHLKQCLNREIDIQYLESVRKVIRDKIQQDLMYA